MKVAHMVAFGRILLGLALLGALPTLVICVDLLMIPQLWPLEVDGWSLDMVRMVALAAGAIGGLGGIMLLTASPKSIPTAALLLVALLPASVVLLSGDQLALGAAAQLDSPDSVIKRYPHLKAQLKEKQASEMDDPYLAYLIRSNAASTPAERKELAEAELARVQALAPPERLVGLERLSMSPAVGQIAHPTAAALRLELKGPTPGPAGFKALEQLVIQSIASKTPLEKRGIILKKTDATPDRFRSKDFWLKCNIGSRAYAAGLLYGGTAGTLVLHRTATIRKATYASEKGEKKNAEYPDFSGYAEVIDPAGKVLYRIDVKPGTIKPDDSLFVTAGDNLDYMLSTSLSDTFCLKLSKAFGGF